MGARTVHVRLFRPSAAGASLARRRLGRRKIARVMLRRDLQRVANTAAPHMIDRRVERRSGETAALPRRQSPRREAARWALPLAAAAAVSFQARVGHRTTVECAAIGCCKPELARPCLHAVQGVVVARDHRRSAFALDVFRHEHAVIAIIMPALSFDEAHAFVHRHKHWESCVGIQAHCLAAEFSRASFHARDQPRSNSSSLECWQDRHRANLEAVMVIDQDREPHQTVIDGSDQHFTSVEIRSKVGPQRRGLLPDDANIRSVGLSDAFPNGSDVRRGTSANRDCVRRHLCRANSDFSCRNVRSLSLLVTKARGLSHRDSAHAARVHERCSAVSRDDVGKRDMHRTEHLGPPHLVRTAPLRQGAVCSPADSGRLRSAWRRSARTRADSPGALGAQHQPRTHTAASGGRSKERAGVQARAAHRGVTIARARREALVEQGACQRDVV